MGLLLVLLRLLPSLRLLLPSTPAVRVERKAGPHSLAHSSHSREEEADWDASSQVQLDAAVCDAIIMQ